MKFVVDIRPVLGTLILRKRNIMILSKRNEEEKKVENSDSYNKTKRFTLPVSYRITHHAMLMKSLGSYIFNLYNMSSFFFLLKYELRPLFSDRPFTCVFNAYI